MADDKTLTVKVAVDGSDFAPGLQKASGDLQRFADKTNAQSKSIQDAFKDLQKGDIQGVKGAFASLAADAPNSVLGLLQSNIIGVSSSLTAAVGPIGLFAASMTAAFAGIIAKAEETAGQLKAINNVARALGQGGVDTQVLLGVFKNGGFDEAGAQAALTRFQSHLGEGRLNPNAAINTTFRRIGLDPELVEQASLRDALGQTFEALKKVENANDRARFAMEIFGRSAIDLAQIIARGMDAVSHSAVDVGRYGLTQEQLTAFQARGRQQREFERANPSAIRNLSASVRDWFVELGNIPDVLDQYFTSVTGRYRAGPGREVVHAVSELSLSLPARETMASNDPRRLQSDEDWRIRGDQVRDAEKLAQAWYRIEQTVGLTAEEAQVFFVRQQGLNDLADHLEAQNRTNVALQTEYALRRQITAQIVAQKEGNLAITGATLGSVEAAKILADLQTRQNSGVGTTPNEAQQQQMLEAIAEAVREGVRTQELTNSLLRRLGPIGQISGGI